MATDSGTPLGLRSTVVSSRSRGLTMSASCPTGQTSLVRLGYLERASARKYRLALRSEDPGGGVVGEVRRELTAQSVLKDLRDEIGYTVSIGALYGTGVLYIHRFFGDRVDRHPIDREPRVGEYAPVYCTALGKVMLASLSDAERRRRVTRIDLVPQGPRSITEQYEFLAELNDIDPHALLVSDEEFVVGARSIAMLIRRPGGVRPMAVEATVPSTAYTVAKLLEHVGPKLMRAARLISEARLLDDSCHLKQG
jgi:IclR family pca regulon transcriptional regulator